MMYHCRWLVWNLSIPYPLLHFHTRNSPRQWNPGESRAILETLSSLKSLFQLSIGVCAITPCKVFQAFEDSVQVSGRGHVIVEAVAVQWGQSGLR